MIKIIALLFFVLTVNLLFPANAFKQIARVNFEYINLLNEQLLEVTTVNASSSEELNQSSHNNIENDTKHWDACVEYPQHKENDVIDIGDCAN